MSFLVQCQCTPKDAEVPLLYENTLLIEWMINIKLTGEKYTQQIFSPIKLISMTPMFVLSLVVTVAIVGSLIFVLIDHVRRQDKAEKSRSGMDNSVTESATHSEAGFDWRRAA